MQLSTRCAKAINQQGTKTSTTTHLSKAMRRKANNKIQDYSVQLNIRETKPSQT